MEGLNYSSSMRQGLGFVRFFVWVAVGVTVWAPQDMPHSVSRYANLDAVDFVHYEWSFFFLVAALPRKPIPIHLAADVVWRGGCAELGAHALECKKWCPVVIDSHIFASFYFLKKEFVFTNTKACVMIKDSLMTNERGRKQSTLIYKWERQATACNWQLRGRQQSTLNAQGVKIKDTFRYGIMLF